MLVLSRKVGEKIQIGDGITVIVTRIAGNRVTLGVEAPRNMRIVRSELKPLPEVPNARHGTDVTAGRRLPGPATLTVDMSPQAIAISASRRAR